MNRAASPQHGVEGREHEDRAECDEGMQLVLPALSLTEVVQSAGEDAQACDDVAHRHAARADGVRRAHEHDHDDTDPHLPPVHAPARCHDPRIQRDQVRGDRLDPRGQRAGGGEPRGHERGRQRDARHEHRERRRRFVTPSHGDDGHHRGEEQHERERVRLDRDRGAERQPGGPEDRASAALGPAHDSRRGGDQKGTHHEVALSRLPVAARDVRRHDRRRRPERRGRAPRPREHRDHARAQRRPGKIEHTPRDVSVAQQSKHREMDEVDPREVHVEDVAIRHGTLADAPGDVVHQRRIVHESPLQRPEDQPRGEGGEECRHGGRDPGRRRTRRASVQNRLRSRAHPSGSRRACPRRSSRRGRARTRPRRGP